MSLLLWSGLSLRLRNYKLNLLNNGVEKGSLPNRVYNEESFCPSGCVSANVEGPCWSWLALSTLSLSSQGMTACWSLAFQFFSNMRNIETSLTRHQRHQEHWDFSHQTPDGNTMSYSPRSHIWAQQNPALYRFLVCGILLQAHTHTEKTPIFGKTHSSSPKALSSSKYIIRPKSCPTSILLLVCRSRK